MKETPRTDGPLGSSFLLKCALPLALLSLNFLSQTRAAAGELRFATESSNGIRLLSATVPTVVGNRLPGSWALIRLRYTVDRPERGVLVTLSYGGVGSWSAPAPDTLAASSSQAEIAIPVDVIYDYFSSGKPANTPLPLHFQLSSSSSRHPLTSGTFLSTTPNSRNAPNSEIPAGFDGPPYLSVGDVGTGWPFQDISEEDLRSLGSHQECLDRVRLIVSNENSHHGSWLDLPGIRNWVNSGGVLVTENAQTEKWASQGAGLLIAYPGHLTTEAADRMLLAARRQTVRWGMGTAPTQSAWPGFRAPLFPLFLTLFLYVMLLIPVNYFVLRRLRQKEMMWITGPVIAGGFCIILAGLCYGFKGTAPMAGRVALVEEPSPGVYSALGHLNVFSPGTTRYRVELPPEALADRSSSDDRYGSNSYPWSRPDQSVTVMEGPQPSVADLPVLQWCSGGVSYYFLPTISGVISGTASFSRAHGWTASVENQSSLNLTDCRVLTPSAWYSLRDLPSGSSGATTGILKSLETQVPQPGGYPYTRIVSSPTPQDDKSTATAAGRKSFEREYRSQQIDWLESHEQTLGAYVEKGVYFIGWSAQPVQLSTVAGMTRYLDQTLVVVPLTLVPGEAGLVAPSGSLLSSKLSSRSVGLWNGPGKPDTAAYTVVRLPSTIASYPDSVLHLSVIYTLVDPSRGSTSGGTTGGGYPPGVASHGGYPAGSEKDPLQLSVWNTIKREWTPLHSTGQLNQSLVDISPVGLYLSPAAIPETSTSDRLVYVRLACPNKRVSLSNVQASLNEQAPMRWSKEMTRSLTEK